MSVSFLPMAFAIPAFAIGTQAYKATGSASVGVSTGAAAGTVALVAYIYSPLPSHNGGFFAPPARKQKWGFTSEPAGEYEDPGPEDYMSASLSGINWAESAGDREE